ncbi:MAG: hypothetical protein HKUEN07_06810 [Rhodocyclaceae bacterium]|nr:MAG: hypothetical protein HKUEN07_06810 [Rhodocyclaceae bacterium]
MPPFTGQAGGALTGSGDKVIAVAKAPLEPMNWAETSTGHLLPETMLISPVALFSSELDAVPTT